MPHTRFIEHCIVLNMHTEVYLLIGYAGVRNASNNINDVHRLSIVTDDSGRVVVNVNPLGRYQLQ